MEELAGAIDFAHTFSKGLAFFAGQLLAQFGLAGDQLVTDRRQYLIALFQAAALPFDLTGNGRVEGLFDLPGVGLGIVAEHILDVRGADISDSRGAREPLAIDVVGKDITGHMHLLSNC